MEILKKENGHLENLHEARDVKLSVQSKVVHVCDEGGHLFFEEAKLFLEGIQTLCRFVVVRGESVAFIVSVVVIRTAILVEHIMLPACLGVFTVRCGGLLDAASGGGGCCRELFGN
jgi:hypothetical protein